MRSLAERQHRFAEALLDPAAPVPPDLVGPEEAEISERFAIYRNNVAVGLIEALRSSFPVVNRLVGDEFFGAMARDHALRSPPDSPVLLAYGGDFPEFIAGFEPAQELPYLADVARLEWHWLEAYHAAEAEPLTADELRHVPKSRLPGLSLTLHPAARFLGFASPALSIWRLHQEHDRPASVELDDRPEHVLLVRPQASVAAIDLTPGAFAFLAVVRRGWTIAEAVTEALETEPAIDVAILLSGLFAAGAFSGFADRQDTGLTAKGEAR